MTPNQKWWAEAALDVLATFIIGWLILGGICASFFPVPADAGEFEKATPWLVRLAVTYGIWKLFRTFNWLKGVPPKAS
jgi:hypothetical protein